MKFIHHFFDRLEDRVRTKLSHFPIIYGFLGGIGIVIFWRGVWHTSDALMHYFFAVHNVDQTINSPGLPWWDGPLSIVIGTTILLVCGVFVSNFIGNEIILSGLRGEKKLAEKTRDEVKTETGAIAEIREEVRKITALLDKMSDEGKK